MHMNIRTLSAEERKYTYTQSSQIESQTGLIGHLRADMDASGDGFFTAWEDHIAERNTKDFRLCFDEVIDALRYGENYEKILKNRTSLSLYCYGHPEASFGNDREYGIRVDTTLYTMLMRLNPRPGEYNLYCYCYVRDWLNQHLNKAAHGIRFIQSDYTERFRIPDGDQIRIFTSGGDTRDRVCRYIDDYHLETNDGFSTRLYHICEFAERAESTGAVVIPLRSSLPEKCFSVSEYSNDLIQIAKGESGFAFEHRELGALTPREAADRLNRELGVTKAQEQAMVAGSMFGWAAPTADPINYDETGKALRPKQLERGDTR